MRAAVKRPDFDFRHAWTLALLGGLLASAAGVFLGVEVGNALQERALTEAQRLAVEPPRMVFDAVRLTQAHRRLAGAVLDGDAAQEPLRQEREGQLDDAIARLGQALRQAPGWSAARADWAEVQSRWDALSRAVAQRRIDAPGSHRAHGELIEAELDTHDRLLDLLPLPAAGWESALWHRTPRLLEALERGAIERAPATERAALQASVAAWARELAPVIDARAPDALRKAFADLGASASASAPSTPAREASAGVPSTPAREASAGMRRALGGLLDAHRHWQDERLVDRALRAEEQARRLGAAAAVLFALGLLCGFWGLRLRRAKGRADRSPSGDPQTPREAPHEAFHPRTPADLERGLIASLRGRAARAAPVGGGAQADAKAQAAPADEGQAPG